MRRFLRQQAILVLVGSALVNMPAAATPNTLGWLEWAWLEPGFIKVKTKLDTGAKTSSIHALDIEVFERDAVRWVRFRVPIHERRDDSKRDKNIHFERPIVRETRIKDHFRKSAMRYVVNLDLCIGGVTFTTPVTLADRSSFNYPLLLGRVALRERAFVDSARIFTASHSCSPRSTD